MANKKNNSIKCPFEDKIKPQIPTSGGRVGTQEDARKEGLKHRPSDSDIYGSVAGKSGGGKFGSSGTIMLDSRRDGRDFNKTAREASDERHNIKEGETMIKFSPEEDSSSIVVSDNGIIVQARGGISAIGIDADKGVVLQGELKTSSSGKSITKGEFTENPQSAEKYTMLLLGQSTLIGGYPPHDHQILPHRHELEPAYLYKMPDVDLFSDSFMKQLTSFLDTA